MLWNMNYCPYLIRLKALDFYLERQDVKILDQNTFSNTSKLYQGI